MRELKIIFSGRVQGVRFRQFVKNVADEIGLKGYVQNQRNGEVVVIAQGDENKLIVFLERVQKGNALSKINSFYYIWRSSSQVLDNFEIKADKKFIADQTSSFFNLGKSLFGMDSQPPKHIAIIPDGNRRWAKERGKPEMDGHKSAASYKHLYSILDEARNLGVEYLTFWLFSTENWKRNREEVDNLFSLMTRFLGKFERDAVKNKICFHHIGRKDRIPSKLLSAIESLENKTKDFKDFNLQIAIDYGGRDEILRAVNQLLANGNGFVTEDEFMKYLDTRGLPDPDMIIRTSGEYRMSGFMPVQGTYAEFYFTDKHFPDFGPKDLRSAVLSYFERQRRHGK